MAATKTTELTRPEWPGAFKLYALSRKAIMLNIGPILIIIAISFFISFLGGLFDPTGNDGSGSMPLYILFNIASFVFGFAATAATIRLELAGTRGQKMDVKQSFADIWTPLVNIALQTILIVVIVILSLLALVIPFFFIAPRLSLAQYFLVDKNMGITESIKASWEQTRGHVSKVWGIVGVSILMALLMLTIIGIPVAIYLLVMYSAAFAVLYNHILGKPLVIESKSTKA